MLSIRLQRLGKVNEPHFRVVVIEHTEGPKSNSYKERLGSLNPKAGTYELDGERIKYWLSVGAQATPTVHNMLVTKKIIDAKKITVVKKKKVEAKAEAVAPVAA
jgi:small subunit ribosomal protein S16